MGRTGIDGKAQATRAQISSIITAIEMFEVNVGRVPTTREGLQALVVRPSGIPETDWDKLFENMPKDDWGEDFIFRVPSDRGLKYDIISKGPNRIEGDEDDIKNSDDNYTGG